MENMRLAKALFTLLSVLASVPAVQASEGAVTPSVAAQAWVLMDSDSGEILAQGNADAPRDPASLTKIMTSYVVGQALKSGALGASDTVTVDREAWAAGNPLLHGSALMFLTPGDRVSVEDLNKGVVVQSGNDACIALADYMSGSQAAFVNVMNDYGEKLGLTHTHFKTVHGLAAAGQFTSARDMAVLSRALIHDLPDEYALYKEKAFTFNAIHQYNRNRLLWSTNLQVDGLKTANSSAGGYSLVASATQGGRRLISVVMGARSGPVRFQESVKLLKWGFRSFETVTAIAPNDTFMTQRVWFGDAQHVALNAGARGTISVPYGSASQLKVSAVINAAHLEAPLSKGQVVGVINFQIGNKQIAQRPLLVMQAVEQGGVYRRLWDTLLLKIYQWLGVCIGCAV